MTPQETLEEWIQRPNVVEALREIDIDGIETVVLDLIKAERKRVAEIVRLADPCTTRYSCPDGEERECVDWGRTVETLTDAIVSGEG